MCATNANNMLIDIDMYPNSIYLWETYEEEIIDIITKLKNKKAVGTDQITIEFLKIIKFYIAVPLVHIANLMFNKGKFPQAVKKAIITPVFKGKNKEDIKNYRPITLLNNISKILEQLISRRIVNFMNKNKIFSTFQNGYLRGRSTERAIYQALHNILNEINNKKKVNGIFLDLSKAFDAVDHERLLKKLYYMGIRGIAHDLIKSYLSDRYQQIKATDENNDQIFSNWDRIVRGVPQGSILGPLLFILYVNDLPDVSNNTVLSYADDTSIIISGESTEDLKRKTVNSINQVKEWFDENILTLNLEKTQIINFHAAYQEEQEMNITINGTQITNTQTVKFLGIILDTRLTWKNHIDYLAPKLSILCYQLRTLQHNVSTTIALNVYHSYIQSRRKYGIIFWTNYRN